MNVPQKSGIASSGANGESVQRPKDSPDHSRC